MGRKKKDTHTGQKITRFSFLVLGGPPDFNRAQGRGLVVSGRD